MRTSCSPGVFSTSAMISGRSSGVTLCFLSPSSTMRRSTRSRCSGGSSMPSVFRFWSSERLARELAERVAAAPAEAARREPRRVEIALRVAVRVDAGGLREHVAADDGRVGGEILAARGRDELARSRRAGARPRRVRNGVWSWIAATTSASRVLPARSPMPFTLVWTPRAPAVTAARQFAVARP